MDTNIQNYTYHDLLDVFNISELNEKTLKIAYKKTMKTHPDYSELDKSYFLFFVKAFKLLKKVYQLNTYREKRDIYSKTTREHIYQELLTSIQSDTEKEIDTEEINKILQKNQDSFHEWFNTSFEKLNTSDDNIDTGYDDWYRNVLDDNECTHTSKATNIRDMHERINQQKETISKQFNQDIIHYNESQNTGGYDLSRTKCEHYDSGIFDKLPYQDLKKAHTETLIPVSETQYHESKKYTLDEYKNERHQQGNRLTSYYKNHEELAREKQQQDEKDNVERYFSLAKQMEQTKTNQSIWNASFKQLKYI